VAPFLVVLGVLVAIVLPMSSFLDSPVISVETMMMRLFLEILVDIDRVMLVWLNVDVLKLTLML
jgi:hypothetical protein